MDHKNKKLRVIQSDVYENHYVQMGMNAFFEEKKLQPKNEGTSDLCFTLPSRRKQLYRDFSSKWPQPR